MYAVIITLNCSMGLRPQNDDGDDDSDDDEHRDDDHKGSLMID